MNQIKIIIGLMLFPCFLFSQIRIKQNMELRVLEEGEMRVTGDADLENGTSYILVDGNLSISGDLTNAATASNFVIESDASNTGSLIVEGNATGDIRVERYLSPSTWHFLSASVSGATTGDFYFNGNPDVYASYWDEPNSAWPYLTGTNEALPLGIGYKIWVAEAKSAVTAEMDGSIRTSDLSVNLTKNVSGWNLIGNPFSSEINTNLGDWGDNTSGSFYVWDSTYNGGDYRVWSGLAGDLTNGIIPISQSFFVYAENAGAYNIPKAAQTHGGDEFYKNRDQNKFIRLQLDGNGFGNTLFIGFPENGTNGIDYKGDAYKIYSNGETSQLYAQQAGEKLCINANKPLAEEMLSIPLYIDQVVNGEYSLTMSKGENLPGVQIMLKDLKTGAQQDLKKYPTYHYNASENDNLQRFKITFQQNAYGFEEEEIIEDLIEMYYANGSICITSQGTAVFESGELHIFNLLGQEIYFQQIAKGELVRIPVKSDQKYIVAQLIKGDLRKIKKIKL